MPAESPQANPFAPPVAPLGPPEMAPPSGPPEPPTRPNRAVLILHWELAQLAYNLALVRAGLMTQGAVSLMTLLVIEGVIMNIAYCIGSVLVLAKATAAWAKPGVADRLLAGGVTLKVVSVPLLAGVGRC